MLRLSCSLQVRVCRVLPFPALTPALTKPSRRMQVPVDKGQGLTMSYCICAHFSQFTKHLPGRRAQRGCAPAWPYWSQSLTMLRTPRSGAGPASLASTSSPPCSFSLEDTKWAAPAPRTPGRPPVSPSLSPWPAQLPDLWQARPIGTAGQEPGHRLPEDNVACLAVAADQGLLAPLPNIVPAHVQVPQLQDMQVAAGARQGLAQSGGAVIPEVIEAEVQALEGAAALES
ncbi:uncharacterized protein LOC106007889 [Heterocephalus glaber]|uniref:Uncharacterized protein LOC106007889 n=1 Tax=Heterocephalus glaber TaxID=10181 RepID=A0AAX6RZA7_HETGA|nr:uncharacterized protein LOC106007889 [Heterocephalus glaber]